MEKIKVLYIDDEIANLQAFRAAFRRVFNVFIANTIEEGRLILSKQQIEVVIADQRMPITTGVEFFESILDLYPNPIRILLTGYSDIKALEDAINKGHVYRFVNKPWNEYDLKLTIENAYHIYQLHEQNNKLINKYQKVFAESSDAIILFDPKGRIIDFNKATIHLFDTIQLQFGLTYFYNYITCKDDIEQINNTICSNGYLTNFECKLTLQNGTKKTCLISANKVCNSYGEIVSYQAIIRDVTKRTNTSRLLLKTAIVTQDRERARIARDLHDELGQTLSGIKFHVEDLKDQVDNELTNQVVHISSMLKGIINQIRTICYDMIPPTLSNYGIQEAIILLCKNLTTSELKLEATFNNNINLIDKDIEMSIYRVIQEFINNSIKYSGCNKITIFMDYIDNQIILKLSDNGHGFNIKSNKKGLGIKNIMSRVESFNGKLKLESTLEKGTIYQITIPIPQEKNQLQDMS